MKLSCCSNFRMAQQLAVLRVSLSHGFWNRKTLAKGISACFTDKVFSSSCDCSMPLVPSFHFPRQNQQVSNFSVDVPQVWWWLMHLIQVSLWSYLDLKYRNNRFSQRSTKSHFLVWLLIHCNLEHIPPNYCIHIPGLYACSNTRKPLK